MTVDEVRRGDAAKGTELFGASEELLLRAAKQLEKEGKAAIIEGEASIDDTGIKFF